MTVKSKWLAVLVLVAAIPLAGCSSLSYFRARDFSNKGVKAFGDQKYSAAAQYFEKAIEVDPTFENARMFLAESYMYQFIPGSTSPKSERNADNAIKTFQYLVDNAKDPEIKMNSMRFIASMYYQMKRPNDSKEWCNRILKASPNSEDAYYRIAVVDYDLVSDKLGVEGELIKYMNDTDKAAVNKALDEGVEMLDKALNIKPSYVDAMEYQKLFWYAKAKLETDPTRKAELTLKADEMAGKVVRLKLKEQNEERKKPKKVGLSQ